MVVNRPYAVWQQKTTMILNGSLINLIFIIVLSIVVDAKRNSDRSNVESMIASLRESKRADMANIKYGHYDNNVGLIVDNNKHPQPFTESINAGVSCPMKGLVVRREMGNLGVTSFQVVAAGLMMDALGPSWSYYDDWPQMAQILRTDRHVSKEEANDIRKQCKRQVTLNPSEQEELSLIPFNITDGSWVKSIREKVCGKDAKWNKGNKDYVPSADEPCIVVKLQGHW
jgi:hypothetical protein